MKRKFFACALCLATMMLPFSSHAAGETRVDIAASAPGGTWFVGLGAYAKVLSTMYPEFDTTLFSGGGIANVMRVAKGDSALGITAVTFMKSAEEGTEPYKAKVKVKALANLNDITRIMFVAPANSNVKSLRQLVDEKVSARIWMGSKVGGNAELFARWIFQAYGADKKQLQANGCTIYGGTNNEASSMLQDGQLDLVSSTNPGEQYYISEVLKTKELAFLPVDQDVADKLVKEHGMAVSTLPASFYGGKVGKDIPVMAAPSGLVVNADLPDEMVYKLAKALVEGRKDIALALPSWDTISPETICKDLPIEIHPGAAKYYREIGCLK